jgi:hypothetical protein
MIAEEVTGALVSAGAVWTRPRDRANRVDQGSGGVTGVAKSVCL